ncbi:RNA polymerase sigma factor [Nocardioides sp. GXZ039]|uniref:RNA polymerase sigma factor n=1 Tax=Nocardioides sp. GXZ039 TaxID=3136018 RepID=UPI0030F3E65A
MTDVGRLLREEWGRLLALLVAQYRRLDLAEDGLADAFEAAARRWPDDGEPANPQGWLLVTARRRILDRLRAEAVAARSLPLLAVESDLSQEVSRVLADGSMPGETGVVDERLRLVLLCAHPTLAREHAAALSLRLVLGVPTADIARLFLVPTPTMAARLTRARKRLAGATFAVPTGEALRRRVADVADIAYLAFTAGYAPGTGGDVVRVAEAGEALRLVRVLREVAPSELAPDVEALLALMLLQHSRREARVADGALVLLPDQDRRLWRADEIAEAIDLLTPLAASMPSTPYLLQALIAAEHAIAPSATATDWRRIAGWYAELEELTGSPVVRLNRAVAVAEAEGSDAGLALLEGLDLPGHRLPAVRAELLARAGRAREALAAYDAALGACEHEAECDHLRARRDRLRRDRHGRG